MRAQTDVAFAQEKLKKALEIIPLDIPSREARNDLLLESIAHSALALARQGGSSPVGRGA